MAEALPKQYGKYVLLRRIAVGGMAEIFRAKAIGAEGFERDIAIKRILPSYTSDESFVRMFKDEAHIAAKLYHANIVQIFDFDLFEDTYYIAMEFVEGKDLREIVDVQRHAGKPLDPLISAQVIMEVAAALHYAHSKKERNEPLNIVHRDVSPHNVMVSFNGEVKLMDFGIAKARERFTQTRAGMVKGKCAYMSPEQVRGQAIDGRSDLFALGVVMWELLTGQRLFVGETDYITLSNVMKAEVPPTRKYAPGVPAELDEILEKALARDPEDRYPTVGDFQRELQRFYFATASSMAESLSEYMHRIFAADIQELERQILEERSLFKAYMADMRNAAPPNGAPNGNGALPPTEALPTDVAPRPAAAPPPEISGLRDAGVSPSEAKAIVESLPSDAVASTVPLGDLRDQVRARTRRPAEAIPGADAAKPASVPEGTGRVAVPSAPARDASGSDWGAAPSYAEAGAPPNTGTGVARVSDDSQLSKVVGKSRAGLYALLVLLALGLGVGAFFLVTTLRDKAAPETPTPTPPVVAQVADVAPSGGPDVSPTGPGTEVPVHAVSLTLTVETDPADAKVLHDGEELESRTIEGVEEGSTITLRAEKEGYVPLDFTGIASGENTTIHLKLEPLGTPDVEVTIAAPVPAEVTVDGKALGTTPVKVTGQPGQLIHVAARAEGFLDWSGNFNLDPAAPINLPLQKEGRLLVTVRPSSATLEMNGTKLEPIADKPGTFLVAGLPLGEKVTLEASANRYESEKETIELTEDGEHSFRLHRKREPKPPTPPPPETTAGPEGKVTINARPWAIVYWRGRKLGTTPLTRDFPVGKQTFVLKKGDVSQSVSVRVKAGAHVRSKVVEMK